MRLVIEFSETKREIDGSFAVCGTKADLASVARQILSAIERDFHYGWVTIYADLPKPVPNTSPEPWDAAMAARKSTTSEK